MYAWSKNTVLKSWDWPTGDYFKPGGLFLISLEEASLSEIEVSMTGWTCLLSSWIYECCFVAVALTPGSAKSSSSYSKSLLKLSAFAWNLCLLKSSLIFGWPYWVALWMNVCAWCVVCCCTNLDSAGWVKTLGRKNRVIFSKCPLLKLGYLTS